ncbi:hypothetical protein Tco_0638052 [Tanacetum coccineum]
MQDINTSFGDSILSSNSLYSIFFITDHYIEPTEFEIQEMAYRSFLLAQDDRLTALLAAINDEDVKDATMRPVFNKEKMIRSEAIQSQPIGISKKQNLGLIDAFGYAIVINDDNHTSKPSLATYCLHGEPSVVRDLDTREPAHNHINIDLEPVVMSLSSTIVTAHFDTVNDFCTDLPFTSSIGIPQSNKQKEICPDGTDQFPVNKGDVLFALDNI